MVNTLDFSNNKSFQDSRRKKKVIMLGAMALVPEIRIYTASCFHSWTTGFYSSFSYLGIHRLGLYLDSVLSIHFLLRNVLNN